MTMKLHSERFSPDGNLSAEGYENLMGTPSLDLLEVLVREATQNACDAMASPTGGILRWRIRQLTTEQVSLLKEQVFTSLPKENHARSGLQDFFENRELQWVLEIMDSGTTGLGGPTRADQHPSKGENPDFVNFFKNIGAARDVDQGGGTYGYGKATLYRSSKCHTIIVDTLASDKLHEERRLLAAQIGKAIPGQYTGRHWWGVPAHDKATADPIVNQAATNIADALGFLTRAKGEKGTSIMILAPHFIDPENPDAKNLANAIEETLLWYFWPRMMKTTQTTQRLRCEIWRGRKFEPATPPENFPPLNLFTKAMNNLRANEEPETDYPIHDIASKRPKKQLGQLTIVHGKRSRRRWLLPSADMQRDESNKGLSSIIPTKCHHLALMRPAEFVVKYMTGGTGEVEEEEEEWAGVFRCDDDDEVEKAFARSEPPAHDDWKPGFLPQRSREKTFVTVALREIKKLLPSQFDKKKSKGFEGSSTPLGKIADTLGAFLATTSGQGAGKKRPKPQGAGGGRKPAGVTSPQYVGLEENGNQVMAIFGFTVHACDGPPLSIEASPRVILEGRAEEPDETTGFPQIVEWLGADGSRLGQDQNVLDLEAGDYRIKIRMPEAVAVSLKLGIADNQRKEV